MAHKKRRRSTGKQDVSWLLLLRNPARMKRLGCFSQRCLPVSPSWVLAFANRNKPNFSHQMWLAMVLTFSGIFFFFFFLHLSRSFQTKSHFTKKSHRWSETWSFDGCTTDAVIFKVHFCVRKMNKGQREMKIFSKAHSVGSLQYCWSFS